jgi:dipeptidyl aminopeptidase/acylaminoacyl peptidase
VNLVSKMKEPIFIAHGKLDPRADVHHAQRMVDALKANGNDVEYFEIPQTGHGIALDNYREEFYARLLRFLDRNIGSGAGG